MTTHAVIITYLRDQTQPAVDAIGGFYRTCVLTGKALVRRPFHWREAIEQGWFITSVSLLPTLAVSIRSSSRSISCWPSSAPPTSPAPARR